MGSIPCRSKRNTPWSRAGWNCCTPSQIPSLSPSCWAISATPATSPRTKRARSTTWARSCGAMCSKSTCPASSSPSAVSIMKCSGSPAPVRCWYAAPPTTSPAVPLTARSGITTSPTWWIPRPWATRWTSPGCTLSGSTPTFGWKPRPTGSWINTTTSPGEAWSLSTACPTGSIRPSSCCGLPCRTGMVC